jgi:hypothetical protein
MKEILSNLGEDEMKKLEELSDEDVLLYLERIVE